jgi:hypothetical protein
MVGEAYRQSITDFGTGEAGVKEAGEGGDPAEFDWSWGTPVPEVDAETFQDVWNSRAYASETDEMGSLAVPQGAGGGLAQGAFAGLSDEQAENARIIIQIGQQRGLSRYAQAIAVMTALGESGLRNLNYGDRDSIGLFQERSHFGSVQDRLDPRQTASRFYDRLMGVDGWQKLKPTMAAHKAQVNADPNHYTKWWNQAAGILQAAYGG